jgi:hypothetical protein
MATWCRRSWRAASAACLLLPLQVAPVPVLECALPDDEARVYQLLDAGAASEPRWRLRLTSRALGTRHVDLPLANARVERTDAAVTVASSSANGGAAVQIVAVRGSAASSLDVFVNFELEVNVWRDLSPDVERMNTHGLQTTARCRVLSSADEVPYHQ